MREDKLIPIIAKNHSILGKNLSQTFELSSGFGIADIVFYNLNKKTVSQRTKNDQSPINSFDVVRILTRLNQVKSKKISLTLIQDYLPSNKKAKDQIITYLLEKGFLLPSSKSENQFLKGEKYKIGLKKVIAIEAKISNWKRGLYQAYRYKEYANQSYLALYSKYTHRALNHVEEFIRFNIGLIEVKDDSISILIKPKSSKIEQNIYSALVFEELLKLDKNTFPNV